MEGESSVAALPVEPLHLLLVEDDPDTLSSLATYLETWLRHARVTRAGDGAEAIRIIDAEAPDMVLADHRMPGATGLEVVRHAHAAGAATMMITAYPDLDLARDALRQGHIVRFFTKPPDPATIAASIQAVIDDLHGGMTREAAFERAVQAARKAMETEERDPWRSPGAKGRVEEE